MSDFKRFSLALETDPYDIDILINLCESLISDGKYKRAKEFSNQILAQVCHRIVISLKSCKTGAKQLERSDGES